MDYMKAYERCMNKARNKVNGGELSELERSELEKCSKSSKCSNNDSDIEYMGLGTKKRTDNNTTG